MKQNQSYLPANQVRARYCVSAMTLWRWLRNPSLGFPKPTIINNRRYWLLAELEAWEAQRNQGALSKESGGL
jgi:predicted DNA-binding transcriptional regulator AlpA